MMLPVWRSPWRSACALVMKVYRRSATSVRRRASARKAAARSANSGCQWLCSCSMYGSDRTTSSVILHSSGLTEAAIRALRSAEGMPKSLVAKESWATNSPIRAEVSGRRTRPR